MKTALLPLALPLALLVTAPAAASDWEIDLDNSEVTFATEVLDAPVTGRFPEFGAAIGFDPDNLADSYIDATVRVTSGEASTASYTDEMMSDAGLAPDDHETATFMSETIVATDACATCYLATGALILKGERREGVELPFSVEIDGDRAVAVGEFVIRREDFGIGGSAWGDAAAEITVTLHIEADRA